MIKGCRSRSRSLILSLHLIALCVFVLIPASAFACSSPAGTEGEMYYNQSAKVMQYCDGTDWIGMNLPGSGSGGCTNPVAEEGAMFFNPEYRVNVVCAGSIYAAMGPYYDPSVIVYSSGGALSSADQFVAVSSGGSRTCGLKADNTIWCWGSSQIKVPTQELSYSQWLRLDKGTDSCGIRDDSSIWCELFPDTAPADNSFGETWKEVASGRYHRCAIRSDDTMWCWDNGSAGDANGEGELGDGTFSNSPTPVQVSGGGTWKDVAVTYNYNAQASCGIKSDDTLWCWGDGYLLGQAGSGTPSSNVPVEVSGGGT